MSWSQFKDPVSHMCLAGTVVAPCSLTQEVAGSSPFNDKYSANSVKTHLGITQLFSLKSFIKEVSFIFDEILHTLNE